VTEDCTDCGMPVTVWIGINGTVTYPHRDEYHQARRRRLSGDMYDNLCARIAVRAGHKVSLRFTASVSFFECSCGINGPLQPHVSWARYDGRMHLATAGQNIADSLNERAHP